MMLDPPSSDCWQNKLAEAYRKTLQAASDMLTFLSLAYWVNFYVDGKCTLSAYHYSLAMDIGLISLSSFVASTLTIRDYYKSLWAAALRFSCIITVMVLLGMVLNRQRGQPESPELLPSSSRKTSAIFLPALCFLDPDFRVFKDNKDSQINSQIGKPQNTATYYIVLMAFNILTLLVGFLRNVFRGHFDKVNGFVWVYRVLASLVIVVTSLFALSHFVTLKVFIDRSGWIQLNSNHNNPENTIGAIDQLVPLFSMLIIPITFAAEYTWPRKQGSIARKKKFRNDGLGYYSHA